MELVVPDNVDDSIEARPTVLAAPGVPIPGVSVSCILVPTSQVRAALDPRHGHAHALCAFIAVTWAHSRGRLCTVLIEQHKLHRRRPLYPADLLGGLGRRSSPKQLTVPLTEVAFPTPVSPSKRMANGLLLALGDLVRLDYFASSTSLKGNVIRVRSGAERCLRACS